MASNKEKFTKRMRSIGQNFLNVAKKSDSKKKKDKKNKKMTGVEIKRASKKSKVA